MLYFVGVIMAEQNENSYTRRNCISDTDLQKLLDLMETVRFGSITLVIQDGKVIQIEKNEKMRLK